jgi:hypothetical protein
MGLRFLKSGESNSICTSYALFIFIFNTFMDSLFIFILFRNILTLKFLLDFLNITKKCLFLYWRRARR